MRYENGATGVIQASTAFLARVRGEAGNSRHQGHGDYFSDKLTTWDVEGESDSDAPVERDVESGAIGDQWRFRSLRSSASFSISAKRFATDESH